MCNSNLAFQHTSLWDFVLNRTITFGAAFIEPGQLDPWVKDQLGTSMMHYGDVIMGAIASQITSLTIVYSTVYSDADQRKHPHHWSLCGEFTGDRWKMYRLRCFSSLSVSKYKYVFSMNFQCFLQFQISTDVSARKHTTILTLLVVWKTHNQP